MKWKCHLNWALSHRKNVNVPLSEGGGTEVADVWYFCICISQRKRGEKKMENMLQFIPSEGTNIKKKNVCSSKIVE